MSGTAILLPRIGPYFVARETLRGKLYVMKGTFYLISFSFFRSAAKKRKTKEGKVPLPHALHLGTA